MTYSKENLEGNIVWYDEHEQYIIKNVNEKTGRVDLISISKDIKDFLDYSLISMIKAIEREGDETKLIINTPIYEVF